MIVIIQPLSLRGYIANRPDCPTRHAGTACSARPLPCMEVTIMRRGWMLARGAVLLAFLGTQHHNLMMLLFAVGLGNAGMSLMTKLPLVREVMLGMSLAMVAVIGYQISRPSRPTAMRVTGTLSVLITLGLAGWSVLHFGL